MSGVLSGVLGTGGVLVGAGGVIRGVLGRGGVFVLGGGSGSAGNGDAASGARSN